MNGEIGLLIFLFGLCCGALGIRLYQRSPQKKSRNITPNTQQKKLERQIITWQEVMQQAPVGYLQVDQENRLFFCNAQARQLLGIEISIERKLLLQIIRSFELDQLIEHSRTTNTSQQKEWIFHPTVDDPLSPVEKADIPIKAHSLPLGGGHVGIFIEDRQEATTLTQQRDRWAADVAHDLKTPLTSIRLIAESLQERVDPALRSWLDNLIKQTIRLTDLVQDLLELGKVDMGLNLKLTLESVNLPEIIQNAWQSLEPIASSKKIKLEYSGASPLNILADESKLYRLLVNILDNSIKHSPPLQIISIKVEQVIVKQQELVEIEMIDCGSGFAIEALPHVFDRFYQSSEQSSVNMQGGSGLGLAIAYQIVKAHKGTISVDNHPETGGAWIKVTLPIRQT